MATDLIFDWDNRYHNLAIFYLYILVMKKNIFSLIGVFITCFKLLKSLTLYNFRFIQNILSNSAEVEWWSSFPKLSPYDKNFTILYLPYPQMKEYNKGLSL